MDRIKGHPAKLFIGLLLGLVVFLGPAVLEAWAARIEVPIEFSPEDLRIDAFRGYDRIEFAGGGSLAEIGAPALPAVQVRVALPEGAVLSGLSVRVESVEAVPGRFTVWPAQPPLAMSAPRPETFVPPDAALYASAAPYPSEAAVYLRHADLGGQGMAILELRPVRYRPAAGALEVLTRLTLEIETAAGGECGDYLPPGASPRQREELEARVRALVVNPEAVELRAAAGAASRAELPAGAYDYVIISSSDLAPSLQDLADWKTKKGVPAKIVTTTWVYSLYSGANPARIRAFVADAHQQWGATYFLLGGDVNKVPTHEWPSPIDPYFVTNDTYYADYDDDWLVEVHVGRATGSYGLYMDIFTSKVLTYEKNPPLTDYAMQAGLFGFDLDANTPCEVCKDFIEDNYWPSGWDITHVYDSQPTDHKQAIIDLIQSGVHLVNHMDHCSVTLIGAGSGHDAWISTVETDAFTNTQDQTIWYSTGCKAGAFDLNCIAEEFCKNANGGILAYLGNSEFGWYNPGLCNTLSNLYDRLFFRTLFVFGRTTLGPCFSEHKNRHFPTSDHERYVFRELTLLGDPELPIWTADPAALAVTHPATVGEGSTGFTVQVDAQGGGPVSGARVCLMKDDEIYLVALTGPGGAATFDLSTATLGVMDVTVTAHNFLPVEQTAEIVEAGASAPEPTGAPSPFRGATAIAFDLPAPAAALLRVFDPAGRAVRTLIDGEPLAAGSHRAAWDGRDEQGRPAAAGVYLYRLEAGGARATRSMILVR